MKHDRYMLLAGIAAFAASAVTVANSSDRVFFISLLCAAAATVLVLVTCIRGWRLAGERRALTARRGFSRRLALGLAAALTLSGTVVMWQLTLGATRARAKSSLGAIMLRAVHLGVSQYCESHGTFPETLQELVSDELLVADQLLSVGDDGAWTRQQSSPEYTSFEYRPGPAACVFEPAILLAFEREAWQPLEIAVRPRMGRTCLFADGEVRVLTGAEFSVAKNRDATRRAELGWPPLRK